MMLAILRAQWLSMRAFRLSAKPASAIFSMVTSVIFYGFWVVAAYAAQAFLANPENSDNLTLYLSPALLAAFLYWQVTPVITATMGASLDMKKLIVYPVPHARLFFIEVMLRVTTCLEMLFMIAGISIGIVRNPVIGGLTALPRVLLASGLFIALNLLLSAGLRSLLERLMLRRRTREIMILLLMAMSIAPQFLVRSNADPEKMKRFLTPMPFFPWGAAAKILLHEQFPGPAALLLLFTCVAYLFGRWQFEAGLRYDGESSTVRKPAIQQEQGWIERFVRFPARFLPDPIGAIFEKETVSLSRMPPFRLIFMMGSALGVILWVPRILNGQAFSPGFLNDNILTFASAYAVLVIGQVTYFNSFGFDRSAAQAWFSMPVPIGKTIAGKNLAAIFFLLLELLLTLMVAFLFRVPLSVQRIAESFCVSLIAGLYLLSFGNLTSTRVPRVLHPEKIGQGGASKAMNTLILLCFPLVLSPVALAYWARSVFESDAVFYGLLGVAAVLGGVLYWVAMDSAIEAASTRREKILAELSRGEGPVSVS